MPITSSVDDFTKDLKSANSLIVKRITVEELPLFCITDSTSALVDNILNTLITSSATSLHVTWLRYCFFGHTLDFFQRGIMSYFMFNFIYNVRVSSNITKDLFYNCHARQGCWDKYLNTEQQLHYWNFTEINGGYSHQSILLSQSGLAANLALGSGWGSNGNHCNLHSTFLGPQ